MLTTPTNTTITPAIISNAASNLVVVRRSGAMAAFAAIAFVATIPCAFADSDHEKALIDRIDYLEKRLQRVERALADKDKARPKSVHKHEQIRRKANELVVADEQTTPQPAPQSQPQTAANTAASAQSLNPNQNDDAPQELNVLRENTVTLKPAGVEVSSELDYITRESQLQHDRGVIDNTTIRYGLLNWLELAATIPLGYTTRTSNISPSSAVAFEASGIGDISFQGNIRLVSQSATYPGVVLSLGAIAPTGTNPYNFTDYKAALASNEAAANPRNPLVDYFSQGSWGFHSNLQIYKIVDPIILFAGGGIDRVFPYSQGSYSVDAFTRFNYNFGFSFALSEKTTLGFSINGSYSPDLHVNGQDIFETSIEPTLARLSVIQRIMKNVWFEPSMAFGLNQDSPDFVVGAGMRARF